MCTILIVHLHKIRIEDKTSCLQRQANTDGFERDKEKSVVYTIVSSSHEEHFGLAQHTFLPRKIRQGRSGVASAIAEIGLSSDQY